MLVLSLIMVHTERAGLPDCHPLFRLTDLRYVLYFLRTLLSGPANVRIGAFGGLVTAGITSNMDYTRGLRAWRWVFIIEGGITVAIAFVAFFILPNFPRTTSWLTEEERQLAVYRLKEDVGEDDWTSSESQSFFHGLKLALLDIKTWILTVLLLAIVSSASVTNFFPTVVKVSAHSPHILKP
jgi:MFS family permease